MWRDWGNPPINSTTAQPVSNPSTATLVAEIDSTQLLTQNLVTGQSLNMLVTWIVGSDTLATWQLEQATSTALSAGVAPIFLKTPTGQSGQYLTMHRLGPNDRLRARVQSTFTASVTAFIQAEVMT